MKVSTEDKGKLSPFLSRHALLLPPPSFLEGLLCDKTETIARETGTSSSALENIKCVVQYSEGYQIFNPFRALSKILKVIVV